MTDRAVQDIARDVERVIEQVDSRELARADDDATREMTVGCLLARGGKHVPSMTPDPETMVNQLTTGDVDPDHGVGCGWVQVDGVGKCVNLGVGVPDTLHRFDEAGCRLIPMEETGVDGKGYLFLLVVPP